MKISKILTILAIGAFVVAGVPTGALAVDTIFTVTAEVPASSSATFGVSKVFTMGTAEYDDDRFDPQADGLRLLDFGILELNADGVFSTSAIAAEAFFYAIDVGSDGAGNPDFTFKYDIGPQNDIGPHAVISFLRVEWETPTSQPAFGIDGVNPTALEDVRPSLSEVDVENGWLRIGVGLSTGEAGEIGVPTGTATASPLTGSDLPGTYGGTLTISTTFDVAFD